tara:strand:+ start:472 stop:1275 length:804 start_codon:yes stop_codon:yes gene_type:complete
MAKSLIIDGVLSLYFIYGAITSYLEKVKTKKQICLFFHEGSFMSKVGTREGETASGEDGFPKDYWASNYSDPESMDCIGNVKEHFAYLTSLFNLEMIEIRSMVDLGFGLGSMIKEGRKKLALKKVCGVEPSPYAFETMATWKKKYGIKNLTLKNMGMMEWLEKTKGRYDLGLCNSVLQYLTTKELEQAIPLLSMRVKFLYLTVPTDTELDFQIRDHEFKDYYARRRSRVFYQKLLKKHFTFISNRLLESRYFFNEETTLFTNLLYRF